MVERVNNHCQIGLKLVLKVELKLKLKLELKLELKLQFKLELKLELKLKFKLELRLEHKLDLNDYKNYFKSKSEGVNANHKNFFVFNMPQVPSSCINMTLLRTG
jgi:hypothetical protein